MGRRRWTSAAWRWSEPTRYPSRRWARAARIHSAARANAPIPPEVKDPHEWKGTAFTLEEREKYNLKGLLPPRVLTQDLQLARCLESMRHYERPLDRYVFLMNLLSRNERLFFRLVQDNLREIMPLIYTPTVGV